MYTHTYDIYTHRVHIHILFLYTCICTDYIYTRCTGGSDTEPYTLTQGQYNQALNRLGDTIHRRVSGGWDEKHMSLAEDHQAILHPEP